MDMMEFRKRQGNGDIVPLWQGKGIKDDLISRERGM